MNSFKTHLSHNLALKWFGRKCNRPEYILHPSANYASKSQSIIETYGMAIAHGHAENTAETLVYFYLLNKSKSGPHIMKRA